MTVQSPMPRIRPRNMSERATEVRAIARDTEHLKVKIILEHIARLLKAIANGRTGHMPRLVEQGLAKARRR